MDHVPMSPPRGRGNVISQPGESQPIAREESAPTLDYPDDVSVGTVDSVALPPQLLAMRNLGKGQKDKLKIPKPGQTWESLDAKKKRTSARGRSLWSSDAFTNEDYRALRAKIEPRDFEDIHTQALESARQQFQSMDQMDLLASVAEMAADSGQESNTSIGVCFNRLISMTTAAGRTMLDAHGGQKPDGMDKWQFFETIIDQVGPVEFENSSEETPEQATIGMMADPDAVISTLTLSQVIDNFDGTFPTKNQERREKARIAKSVLTRQYKKKEELEIAGEPIPLHLQNLPPKPEPEPPRDNLRTPSRTPSAAPPNPVDIEDRPAPQVRVIDGQVVLDEASLVVEPTMQNRDQGDFPSMDRDNGDKPVTSYTYMRRKNHADRWTDEEDKAFYECLSYWGTDLSMVSKCFPTRAYKQIKAKLLREEKTHPTKVKNAIMKRARCGTHSCLVD